MTRKHGTRYCYVAGCREPECVQANREYQRARYVYVPKTAKSPPGFRRADGTIRVHAKYRQEER